MKKNQLGRTGIEVTNLCLGSMTWGTQNTEAEGHAQMDRALDYGINFVDTAEMYPVNPISEDTIGGTETIIGTWNAANKAKRGDYVLATKISGEGMRYTRGGARISGKTLAEALEGSLTRLQTDYVDLYQLHWPNRGSFQFRQYWNYDPSGRDTAEQVRAEIEDILEAAAKLIDAGKMRAIGLSNESAWGMAQWARVAEEKGLPRVASIQNEYSLMCRIFDTDAAEASVNEDIGLLSFSPLAVGLLTGKYRGGAVPKGSRLDLVPSLGGRYEPRAVQAVDAYCAVADKHGLDPAQMALAWCATRPFMTSAIFGATTMAQLETALGASEVTLSDEVLSDLAATHKAHPMPY